MRSYITFVLLAVVAATSAAPAELDQRHHDATHCSSLHERKEWRSLTITERLDYIDAVKCLNTLPSTNTTRGTVSRFDDFSWTHVAMTPVIHGVGQFYPWHRHFVTLYDKALRDECDYTGPTPYWDWRIEGDSISTFASSSLLDPVHGFGGNGVPGTYTLPPDPNNELEIPPFGCNAPAATLWNGCVQTGPFKDTDFRLNVGPGRMMTDHCITRNFNTACWGPLITTSAVAAVLTETDFYDFSDASHIGPHLGGHAIFGGVMSNGFSTCGDPLFFVHHAGVDRLWATWQAAAPTTRLNAIGGPTTNPPGTEEVTLDFVLEYPTLAPSVTVREVMDISKTPSCYEYDELIV